MNIGLASKWGPGDGYGRGRGGKNEWDKHELSLRRIWYVS
jgi:hypothetical protein